MRSPRRRSAAAGSSELSPSEGSEPDGPTVAGNGACAWEKPPDVIRTAIAIVSAVALYGKTDRAGSGSFKRIELNKGAYLEGAWWTAEDGWQFKHVRPDKHALMMTTRCKGFVTA